ncbi:T-cell surface glycoprotein CD8 alpha chain [Chaetodon auriga]|uniref:T-cell surface glycoprotein CD8 alpha chain n=1 Tax=Chaetodon auriga TaxID=39042 RepID=UPI004032D68B
MDQRWILVILVFYQKITSGAGEDKSVKEGNEVEIQCQPSEVGSMVVWFRVLDNSGMEFIASFSNNGVLKSPSSSFPSNFKTSRIAQNILILKSFNKIKDSGVYSCAALYKGTELRFGTVTRLLGDKTTAAQLTTAKTITIRQSPCTTAAPCVCNNNYKKEETSPFMFCTPIILGPLVGACGLLLLLLIVVTAYCNHVRTRRCPHHHKRKPRATPDGKQMRTGRHV